MTAQIGETLHYDGREHTMCSEPLGDYFALGGEKPAFLENCTALWRGYIGTWEIRDGRLYLVNIDARLQDGTKVTLADLFPGFPERVFAHWYSGTLRLPDGKQLLYVHMGYSSKYERDILVRIEKGVVRETEVRINGKQDDPDAPEGYSVDAMTVFHPESGERENK